MVLTNNWMTLVWLLLAGSVLYFFPRQKVIELGRKRYIWSIASAISLVIPYIIWAGFRVDTGDTGAYRYSFMHAPATITELPSYVISQTKDQGFSVLTVLLKAIIGNSDVIYFLIIAAFQMLCLAFVYRKYSVNYLFSIFLFVASTDYFSWLFNGMRQFIAVTGIFACTGLMLKKKYLSLVVVILLLSTIHASALIMIPVVYICQGRAWNKKTLFFIFSMAILIAFIDKFTPVIDTMMAETQYSDIMTNEVWLNDDGTNILRVFVYSVPAILSFIGKRYVEQENIPIINLSVNMSICAAAVYFLSNVTSGVYVGRLPVYMSLYSYISLPWLFENMFTLESKKIMYLLAIAAYVVFFYYQMFVAWG